MALTPFLSLCQVDMDSVNRKFLLERLAYVEQPNLNDTLCLSEIKRARNDIKNHGIIFTEKLSFFTGIYRYEKADSLFLSNAVSGDSIIKYMYCDEEPRLPSEEKRMEDIFQI